MPFESFNCVFDALADKLADAPGLKARFELLSALQLRIQDWGLSPQAAAIRLGITSFRLNNLLKGQLNQFSLDALVKLAAAADSAIEPQPRRAADDKGKIARVASGRLR